MASIADHQAEIPLDKSSFERALAALVAALGQQNPGSYQSTGCVRCTTCMFTTDSQDCFGCTYCDQCVSCSRCTHCSRCTGCSGSKYCVGSTNCHESSYVLLSHNCHECIFCFGCVGLHKKEFHILNKPFKKTVYFKLIEELKLAIPM